MRVTLFDYGAGNLHSLSKALAEFGADVHIEPDPVKALDTDALVLPGVGAFSAAAERLAPGREQMKRALEQGLPCLGICLGMQLFYERSEEGPGQGLGVFTGEVTRLRATRVPHMGWNVVSGERDSLLSRASLDTAYFAHSYVCRGGDSTDIVAWTSHDEDRFASVVRKGDIVGVQFHPEKSSTAGLRLIRTFLEEAG